VGAVAVTGSEEGGAALRIAAVGDLHVVARMRGLLRPDLAGLSAHADLLLLAGDLTNAGRVSQAHTLVGELGAVDVPMVAVLGNHDFDDGSADQIRGLLTGAGVHVLDGRGVLLDLAGLKVGIAGTVGFDGGDDPAAATEAQRAEADALTRALVELDEQAADIRIALTHFAPVSSTLDGEPADVLAYLWSAVLGRAVDEGGADLAVHGHAHYGNEIGATPGGIPVRNAAKPLLGRPYALHSITPPG
jgi:Icc-related predicted phosphoesterase